MYKITSTKIVLYEKPDNSLYQAFTINSTISQFELLFAYLPVSFHPTELH